MAKVPHEEDLMLEVTVRVPIDSDMLDDHIGKAEQRGGPYSRELDEWDVSDVFRAAGEEILLPDEGEVVNIGIVPS